MISGFAIGWAFYALLLSPYVMGGMMWAYRMLSRFLRILIQGILWPIRRMLRWVFPTLRSLALRLKKSDKSVQG
jgi:cytochrome c oxidase assembly factor CtaG